MKNNYEIHSDSDSVSAKDLLKQIKNNSDVKLTSNNLLNFLCFFEFIKKCKNDETINKGYVPADKYQKLLQSDVYNVYQDDIIRERKYTIKFTKEAQNYFMPFILKLIELRKIVNIIKEQY